MPFDFVPHPSAARAMAACIANKVCRLQGLGGTGVGIGFSLEGAIGGSLTASASITAEQACLLGVVTEILVREGIVPAVPPTPDLPDFTEELDSISGMVDESEQIIPKYMQGIINFDFDEDGNITRIYG